MADVEFVTVSATLYNLQLRRFLMEFDKNQCIEKVKSFSFQKVLGLVAFKHMNLLDFLWTRVVPNMVNWI